MLCVQYKTPDDGQRNCPKHVEFHSKNKYEKLVHLVGFIIRNSCLYHAVLCIYHTGHVILVVPVWTYTLGAIRLNLHRERHFPAHLSRFFLLCAARYLCITLIGRMPFRFKLWHIHHLLIILISHAFSLRRYRHSQINHVNILVFKFRSSISVDETKSRASEH